MNTYDNPFYHDNVYGHTLALLANHSEAKAGIHLDFGCSFGRIAEHLIDHTGNEYIGFDINGDAIESLGSRGFGAHQIDLSDIEAAEALIRSVVGDKRIASISIIDTLEHLTNDEDVLGMLRRIASPHVSPLVISVPNVGHRDIGFKLAFGKWDYTAAGLLDVTHFRFFTEELIDDLTQRTGWHRIAANDVIINKSDQHFPPLHPAIAEGTRLHAYLVSLRDQVDLNGKVNQFVRIYLPGPIRRGHLVTDPLADKKPFLSVVTRTQGKRLDTLRDVFLCLSAQTSQDFEVCVIGHKLSREAQLAVERVIEDTNEDIRSRIRLIRVDDGNRTAPLNAGFRSALGDYVAILDDDDIALGHWVEEFQKLAASKPGRVLRLGNVAQKWQPVQTQYSSGTVRSVDSLESCYPFEFDYFQHLLENATPPVSLAFPRAAFSDLHVEFDESLSTTEDWDFLMRNAEICGVAGNKEITSIYRKWDNAESSYTVHSQQEWIDNHHAIWRKLDSKPILLQPGSASRIRMLVHDWNLRNGNKDAADVVGPEKRYEYALREQIYNMLESRTWKVGAPLRAVSSVFGKRFHYPPLWAMRARELEAELDAIKRSRSWKFGSLIKRYLGR